MFEAAQSEDSSPTDFTTEAHDVSGPKIIFSTVPAVLVMVEGDPILRDVTGTTLKRVVNTKALILRDEADAALHQDSRRLDAGVRARELVGSVRRATGKRRHRLSQAAADASVNLLDGPAKQALGGKRSLNEGEPPEIYVSTTPAILVVTNGLPQFATVPGTTLEYVTNTTSHIFREPTDRELYVLTRNGWYRSWRTEGPWQSIASAQLPSDIARLPSSQLALAGGRGTMMLCAADSSPPMGNYEALTPNTTAVRSSIQPSTPRGPGLSSRDAQQARADGFRRSLGGSRDNRRDGIDGCLSAGIECLRDAVRYEDDEIVVAEREFLLDELRVGQKAGRWSTDTQPARAVRSRPLLPGVRRSRRPSPAARDRSPRRCR